MVTDRRHGGYDMNAAVFQVSYQVNCDSNNFIFTLYCICGLFGGGFNLTVFQIL